MKQGRFSWRFFLVGSVLVVGVVFGTVRILETTLFAGASLHALKYLYVIRGAGASFLVVVLGILFFVAERRQAEIDVKKLHLAVEQSPVTIVVTDQAAVIQYVNPRFSALTGYRFDEVLGKKPSLLKSGKTAPHVYRQLWKTITSGNTWSGEFLNKKKDGELYWEAASISPIVNNKGRITHYVGVLEDITQRKKMDELKDMLVGTVSHELRTPLAIIKLSSGNLRDGLAGPLTKDQQEIVEGISHGCQRLSRIIDEVLDLSRLESGKARMNKAWVNVNALVHDAVNQTRKAVRDKPLDLGADLPPEALWIFVDADLIMQVLTNLLDNAVRFAKNRIIVRAQMLDQPSATGPSVQVSVIDDGQGIAMGDLKKLFSKYEQIRRSAGKNGYKGTGLGLAICKEIVEQHGGAIWVDSEIGAGASFHLTLPQNHRAERGKENHKTYEEGRKQGPNSQDGARCG